MSPGAAHGVLTGSIIASGKGGTLPVTSLIPPGPNAGAAKPHSTPHVAPKHAHPHVHHVTPKHGHTVITVNLGR